MTSPYLGEHEGLRTDAPSWHRCIAAHQTIHHVPYHGGYSLVRLCGSEPLKAALQMAAEVMHRIHASDKTGFRLVPVGSQTKWEPTSGGRK